MAKQLREFAFDVMLSAAIRVKATGRKAALALLTGTIDCADSNLGAWPNGDPILCEASLATEFPPELYEIDGEAIARPYRKRSRTDAQWLKRATDLLAESLSKWEDEEDSVREEKADHIEELNAFFKEYNARKR